MSREQLERAGALPPMGSDDAGCNVLHVDMDAFFAAVELRDRPELRGRPVIVGRRNGRGVVVSATYEARAAGVHSAMPMGTAMRACPAATVIEPSREKYSAASRDVMAILNDVTAYVDEVSIDEAFLDVSGARRTLGSPTQVATEIRTRMKSHLQLPCSVGVGTVTMVAKIASTMAKPDGLLVVPAGDTVRFLHSLPVGRLWGVGSKTVKSLGAIGVYTVADLAALPPTRLAHAVGRAHATRLASLAAGHEVRPIAGRGAEKSIGSEHTFDVDVTSLADLEKSVRLEVEEVARRARSAGLTATTVTVKVRFEDFRTTDRSRTMAAATDSASAIFVVARDLLRQSVTPESSVRLVGVRLSGLAEVSETGHQLSFDSSAEAHTVAEETVDQIVARFGPAALQRASLIRQKE
ncbi:MAG: DNA polymerase IV [Candidatus Nanopelagicales bacterium]|jgi:DNA polymerase-4